MLFYLAEQLRDSVGSLNVVRYVSFRVMAAFVTSLLICMIVYPGSSACCISGALARSSGTMVRQATSPRQEPRPWAAR